ncbi:arginase [Vibrio panuliri]|uniref:Arginase n=1 Tax=Vibrio panuliri TaxID=1381081 RepID=A0A1Q9HN04_9VIBR|nr:arginase family protein [Vibrio panuliri]OLQ92139.1 arginase [Vibrio panuliri]
MARRYDIIGAPFNQLGFFNTTENTVEGLRRMDERTWVGLSDWIHARNSRWRSEIRDVGDVIPNNKVIDFIAQKRNEEALAEYSNQLKSKVLHSYQSGRFPITIGGDHSISVGTLLATLDFYQNQRNERVAIVWVDAHADCNSSLESNLHGKPLAMLTNEYCHNGWSVPEELALSSEQIFYIGVRDYMPSEYEFIQRGGVTNYDMPHLDTVGMQSVLTELLDEVDRRFDRVYLSFDYDVLDGSIFRSCATPSVGGISAREAIHLVHTIASSPKFVGADFVEYLPELDSTGVSKELMVKLIDAVWGFRG